MVIISAEADDKVSEQAASIIKFHVITESCSQTVFNQHEQTQVMKEEEEVNWLQSISCLVK